MSNVLETADILARISKVLKKRFPNLTVEDTLKISGEILVEIELYIDR